MSLSKEDDLHHRLLLFESSVSHASIRWYEPQILIIFQSSEDFFLPKGEYRLSDLVDKKELHLLESFHSSIKGGISEIYFSVNFQGKKNNVRCCVKKEGDKVEGLWVEIPEKDNSILYLQNAAHDFRAPLGSIIGIVNLMQHSMKSESKINTEEMITFLDMIKFSTDKALNLASEIMELAEIESESYELKLDRVVMKDFVQRYLETHRLLTLKKQIKVVFNCHSDASAMLNESKMTRVLDNLITNAVKFSEKGTTINLTLSNHNDTLMLSIKDEGIGMSQRILDNLFVKFGESKRSGLDGEPTHGLGMSIVQQIMKLHHGDVKVKSQEMRGTQVDLILNKE